MLKSILLSLLFSQVALAGSPEHGGYFCKSKSNRTHLTIFENYLFEEPSFMFFAIDGSSTFFDERGCENGGEFCDKIEYTTPKGVDFGLFTVTYQGNTWLEVEVSENGTKAKIRPGFTNPHTGKEFKSPISLHCTPAEEKVDL